MIKLIKSTFYHEHKTKKALAGFITKAKQLSFGQECEKFEKNFANWQGKTHCVMLNSGSSANLAIIQALMNLGKLRPGDKVGFSALTWSTNVMPLFQLGLQPVPVDVELETLNISSQKLRQVDEKIPLKALFITNLLGFCDDLREISKYCREKKILLIEDNCESLGTVYQAKKLGNFGLAATFSFYVGHHMSTIEGGAVCTDNQDLATMLRLVRAHGWDRNLDFLEQSEIRAKYKVNSTFYSRYTFYDLGFNLRPTEIAGFIGNQQLLYIDEIISKRQANFLEIALPIYRRSDLYYPVKYTHLDVFSNFAIPLICRSQKIRDRLVQKCDQLIEIRPIVGGDMTRQPFFGKYQKIKNQLPSNARLIHEQGLYFGNNPELTQKEKQIIIKTFTKL